MTIEPYRRVLALPGVRALMLVGFVARIPPTAAGIALTLHVVRTLNLGFTQAGLLGATVTIGIAIGGPVAGRLVDRHGLRPVLLGTTIAQGLFWFAAPSLPYYYLLAASGLSGLLAPPVFGSIRQCLAAMVPEKQRRTAFALDSMAVELSYMTGPAVAVAAVTASGSPATLYTVGVGMIVSGASLLILNPPTQSAAEQREPQIAVARRRWLRPAVVTVLTVTAVSTFVLATTELSVIAMLESSGATAWTGLVIGVWCTYSLIGGFIYGALRRSVSPLALTGWLSAFTVPLALVGGGWWWLLPALVPAGLLAAPSLSAAVDTLSRLTPAAVRGEAMGLHSTALMSGVAGGTSFAGAVIDSRGPAWAFAATGLAGLALVAAALPFWRRSASDKPGAEPQAEHGADPGAGPQMPQAEPVTQLA